MEGKVFLGQNLIWVMLVLGQLHGYKSCIQKERMSLLELKTYLISTTQEGRSEFVFPSWTNDTTSDCCRWEGVHCNPRNKRVMGLSISRMFFKENYLLNLSLLHPFEEIRILNLSECSINGLFDDMEGYRSLRRLSNLEILDLSSNEFNNSIFPFLNSASSLTTLFLRDNYLEGPLPVKELRNLTNLELLDVSINSFNCSMPVRDFPHLKNLKTLILWGNGDNEFSSSMELLQELNNLTNLEVLDLGGNRFYGPVPIQAFCEMKNLRELSLYGNHFVGQFPLCLGSLNKLRVLDLSYNQFSGNLPSSFSSLQSLEYLALLHNDFNGFFSLSPLANLTKLKVLKLSSTSNMVQIETESTWQPKFQLSVAALPFCSLEKIPSFLLYQKNLRLVDLSSNRISGNIPTWLLTNNPELEVLQLQNNSFTILQIPTRVYKLQFLDFSANDISGVLPDQIGHVFPNLVHMNGSDNGFQGNIPASMSDVKSISFLDLSHNNFSGELPKSLFTGCFSLTYLQLSHNKFSGHVLPRQISLPLLTVLRIDNNLFTGKIGDGGLSLVNLSVIDMSNNLLRGAIPTWISDLSLLYVLSLSNNLLNGTIPPSLLAKPYLSFLDLSGNLLSGTLPSYVNSTNGIKLFLDSNNLTGPIPRKLLENVNILTMQNNKLSGSIPRFVNTMDLSILLLRGNNLTESIPKQLCDLSNMRLLDLSHNKLNGIIPSCLNNLLFGLREEFGLGEEYIMDLNNILGLSFSGSPFWGFYKSTLVDEIFQLDYDTFLYVEIKFAAKHRYEFYSGNGNFPGGTLDHMYGLDLSGNGLSGAIPVELGDLSKLRVLNLSHNFLSSAIPDNFSKLRDIESLDLSYNMLHGNFSPQITSLTSLAVFNVSYNNLSGIIPRGAQFNTFSVDSYLGNPLLCGPPTNKSCEPKKSSEEGDNEGEEEDDKAEIDMKVFYWSTASSYAAALIGILVLMCFDCSWRRAWIHLSDAFIASAKSFIS